MQKIAQIAMIVYGDGGELGSFKIFADTLKKDLSKKYKKVVLQYANRDTAFFDLVKSVDATKEQIAELHIFTHSIGAGIFLGYKDPSIGVARNNLVSTRSNAGKKVTYVDALKTEIGAIQTDDLIAGTNGLSEKIYRHGVY